MQDRNPSRLKAQHMYALIYFLCKCNTYSKGVHTPTGNVCRVCIGQCTRFAAVCYGDHRWPLPTALHGCTLHLSITSWSSVSCPMTRCNHCYSTPLNMQSALVYYLNLLINYLYLLVSRR